MNFLVSILWAGLGALLTGILGAFVGILFANTWCEETGMFVCIEYPIFGILLGVPLGVVLGIMLPSRIFHRSSIDQYVSTPLEDGKQTSAKAKLLPYILTFFIGVGLIIANTWLIYSINRAGLWYKYQKSSPDYTEVFFFAVLFILNLSLSLWLYKKIYQKFR